MRMQMHCIQWLIDIHELFCMVKIAALIKKNHATNFIAYMPISVAFEMCYFVYLFNLIVLFSNTS